jgi:hypothetical protein
MICTESISGNCLAVTMSWGYCVCEEREWSEKEMPCSTGTEAEEQGEDSTQAGEGT